MKTKIKKQFNNDIVIEIDQKNRYDVVKHKGIFYFKVKGEDDLVKLVYIETEHVDCKLENIEIKVLSDNKIEKLDHYEHKSVELYEIYLDKFNKKSVFNRILVPISYVYKQEPRYNNSEKRQNILLSIEYMISTDKLVCKIVKDYKVETLNEEDEYIENKLLNKCKKVIDEYFKSYGIFSIIVDIGKAVFFRKR